jgi:peptidoglycan/xylan/chitin deacetylase (PgdA/CDA1 family)
MWEKYNLINRFNINKNNMCIYYNETFDENNNLYCFYNITDVSHNEMCIPELIIYNIPNCHCLPDTNFIEYKNKFTDFCDSVKLSVDNACWFGTKYMFSSQKSSSMLRTLFEYADSYPDLISVNNIVSDESCQHDISLFKFSIQCLLSYKYFIYLHGDIHSGILKWLLFTKRVVFIIEPTYVEYFYKDLIPYKHFVPVKKDMSNLVEQINLLNEQPDKYNYISNSAFEYISNMFSEENLISIFKSKISYNNDSISRNYLTFDDGPHPIYTIQILDILKKNNVKSTFFVLGENATKYPNIINRIYNEGHTIGIHGWNHDNIIVKSSEDFVEEINNSIKTIQNITGFSPLIYRPPSGEIDEIKSKILGSQLNMKIIMGNVDSSDYNSYSDSKSITSYVLSQMNNNSIIVFHDTFDKTVKAIDMLLSQSKNIQYDKL